MLHVYLVNLAKSSIYILRSRSNSVTQANVIGCTFDRLKIKRSSSSSSSSSYLSSSRCYNRAELKHFNAITLVDHRYYIAKLPT